MIDAAIVLVLGLGLFVGIGYILYLLIYHSEKKRS